MESLSTLQHLHFLRPLWFLALIPAAFLIGFLVKNKQASSKWQSLIQPDLLPYLIVGEEKKNARFGHLCTGPVLGDSHHRARRACLATAAASR